MSGLTSWLARVIEKRRELHSQAFIWIVAPLMVMLVLIFLINMYAYQQVIESLVKARNQELARMTNGWPFADGTGLLRHSRSAGKQRRDPQR